MAVANAKIRSFVWCPISCLAKNACKGQGCMQVIDRIWRFPKKKAKPYTDLYSGRSVYGAGLLLAVHWGLVHWKDEQILKAA